MIHIECTKNILTENINIVSRAVASHSTVPLTSCILLISDRKGFRLLANDMDISIETENMEAEVYELGTVAINAKIFGDTIRTLPDEVITIKTDKNNNVEITAGKAFFKLKGYSGDEFPKPQEVSEEDNHISINSAALKNMIKRTIFSVSTDTSRPVLTGELLRVENNVLNVVAIDGFRVSWLKMHVDFDDDVDIVVPAKTLNEFTRLMPDTAEENINIYFNENTALFVLKNCRIVTRLLEGEFLNYENLFKCDTKTEALIDRDTFLRCLERTMVISDDNKKSRVNVKLSDNKIIVDAVGELGNIHEDFYAEISGDDIEIAFNSRYIIDILKSVDDEKVSFNFMTPKSPCIIKSTTGLDYLYLVLPLLSF